MERCLLGLLLLALLPAQALAEGSRHYLLFEYATGGDELVDPDSGRSLRAGELLQISYGYKFFSEELPQWQVDLRAGLKFSLIDVEGGEGSFYRYPLEVAFHRKLGEKFSIGFGAAYHLYPTYELDAGSVDDEIDFDDAFGGFLHAEYHATPSFAFGARYLRIEYDKEDNTFLLPSGDLENEIDGSSFSGYVTYTF
ncbi:MAG: outer membrane beta-barrel protein [Gammaproteobacteria bacterium]|nr:outer membrane beta-barrel protein [Gammaproteobacteria bacterium]